MENSDKIIEGLEKAYLKLIEFKKYKKSPIVISRGEKIVEVSAESISKNNIGQYKK
ncbi:hypothetical protein R9C00_21175 [Flammeovirgaceae bacterium SG7u.111]|nr:hypothetical protein [Flammeovirgaceae bacterium SG7u.132]WPO34215.1 hypothetical protein R9C00_21175 [Flammeovirgaceae bacterium SG7u.111]